jgi:outer membrane protein OmpU
MNKLTKVGCSALCGSLAAIVSANAGTLTVSGGADLTFTSIAKNTTGHPIGMGSNLSFKGSGELDNGWTYDLTIAHANKNAYSAANLTMTMGGLGKINVNQGNSGNGIAAMDDKMPTAWEESWGAGLSGGVKLVLGSGASQNIMYTSPTLVGTTITMTYAHEYGASDVADKGTKSADNDAGRSYDATINMNPSLGTEILSGLNVFLGASTIESRNNGATEEDQYQGVGGLTYDLGPISIGAQWSGLYTGQDHANAVTYHTYKNHAFGVAFNVNDSLSVSYGEYQSRKAGYNNSEAQATSEAGRVVEVSSWQAAYTMGGASFRIADTTANNVLWSAGDNQTATTVSLGLAF